MPFDEDLAVRTRAALGDVSGVTEIRMFGGLCFTVNGNMAVGVTGDDLMVRLAPDDGEAALSQEWLATSDDSEARTSGGYWYHQRRTEPEPMVHDRRFQDELLAELARFTGTRFE